jgi:hypothetical protein
VRRRAERRQAAEKSFPPLYCSPEGSGRNARPRAMIRNNSGGGLINKNPVAESTLTGLAFVSVLASKREEKNLQNIDRT